MPSAEPRMSAEIVKSFLLLLVVQCSVYQCLEVIPLLGSRGTIVPRTYQTLTDIETKYSLHSDEIVSEGRISTDRLELPGGAKIDGGIKIGGIGGAVKLGGGIGGAVELGGGIGGAVELGGGISGGIKIGGGIGGDVKIGGAVGIGKPLEVAGEAKVPVDVGGDIEYYTVKPQFVELVTDVRKNAEDVQLRVRPEGRNLFSVSITVNGKQRDFKNIEKKLLSLFIKLLKDATLQINTVAQVGPLVKISVSPEPPKPTNILQVKPIFLDLLKKIRDEGGVSLKIATVGDKYTFIVTDDKGERTFPNVETKIAKAFIRLVKDPDLQFQVLGKSDDQVSIFLPSFSGKRNTFSVGNLFLDLLKLIRTNPDNKIQIEPGTDGKYVLIVDDGKKPREYPHIEPDLLYVFTKLIRDPDLQFKVLPTPNGRLTITIQDKPKTPNVQVVDQEVLLAEIKRVRNDPTYKISIDPGKIGLDLVITHGDEVTRYPLPADFLNVVIKLITEANPPKETKVNGHTAIILADRPTTTHEVKIHAEFVTIIDEIKKHPERKYSIKLQPDPQGKYTVIVILNGQPRTIKNIPVEAVKFLLKLSKDPRTPHHIVVEEPKRPDDLTLVVPHDNTEPIVEPVPTPQVEILQIVKASPQLILNIEPQDDDHFTITLTDGDEVKRYPNVRPEFVLKLIDIRNEQNLPLEIKPGKPGEVNVLVPTSEDPDVDEIEADIHILRHIQNIRRHPKLELRIRPDNEGTYTVILSDGKKPEPIDHVTPEILLRLVQLKTRPNPKFTIKSGKPGKVIFVVPKTQEDPVRIDFTPGIIRLLQDVRRKPQPEIVIRPHKPGTYVVEVNGTPYDDLPSQLIPIIIRIASQPDVEYEIRPGKDNTIVFVPAQPSPDSDRYTIIPDILEVISNIRRNPKKPIQIRPGKPGTFIVELPGDEGKPRSYPDIDPDTLNLIIYLKSHPEQPFSVKPTTDGKVYILLPKSDVKDEDVPLKPTTLILVQTLRQHPNLDIKLEPQPDGTVTVVLSNPKKTKRYPDIPLRVLPIIFNVYSRPDKNIPIKPTDDGDIVGKVPNDLPTTIDVVVSIDDVELIHDIRRKPKVHVRVIRNPDDSIDVVVEPGRREREYPDVSPKIANLVIKLLTHPKLPFKVLTGKNGKHVLVIQKRPRERAFKDIPKLIVDLLEQHRHHPHITLDVTSGNKPDTFTVEILKNDRPLRRIPDIPSEVVQLISLLLTQPQIEYRSRPQDNDRVTIIPSTDEVPTIDIELEPDQLQTIRHITKPGIIKVDVVPTDDNKYSIVLQDGKKPRAITNIGPLFLNVLVRLQTEPKLPIKVYVSDDGKFVATIPKRVSHNVYPDIDVELVDLIKALQPSSRDTTYSIITNDRPDDFTVEITSKTTKKSYSHIPSNAVQLITLLLSQPHLHVRIINERNNKATVHVTSHLPYVVFKHVRPSFIHLSEVVCHNPDISVELKRRPNNEVDIAVIGPDDTLHFRKVHPTVAELFVSLYSRRDFPHHFYLDDDDSATLVIRQDSLNPRFSDVHPKLYKLIRKLRLPKDLHVRLSRSGVGIDAEIRFNHDEPIVLTDLRPSDVQLLTLLTTHHNLQFREYTQPDGTITVAVTIPSRSTVLDFALLIAGTDIVEKPQPLPEPIIKPEVDVIPKVVLRPRLNLVPQVVVRPAILPISLRPGGLRTIGRAFKAGVATGVRAGVEAGLDADLDVELKSRRGWYSGKIDTKVRKEDIEIVQGSESYYSDKRHGHIGRRHRHHEEHRRHHEGRHRHHGSSEESSEEVVVKEGRHGLKIGGSVKLGGHGSEELRIGGRGGGRGSGEVTIGGGGRVSGGLSLGGSIGGIGGEIRLGGDGGGEILRL